MSRRSVHIRNFLSATGPGFATLARPWPLSLCPVKCSRVCPVTPVCHLSRLVWRIIHPADRGWTVRVDSSVISRAQQLPAHVGADKLTTIALTSINPDHSYNTPSHENRRIALRPPTSETGTQACFIWCFHKDCASIIALHASVCPHFGFSSTFSALLARRCAAAPSASC
jgi:hypothetical protein